MTFARTLTAANMLQMMERGRDAMAANAAPYGNHNAAGPHDFKTALKNADDAEKSHSELEKQFKEKYGHLRNGAGLMPDAAKSSEYEADKAALNRSFSNLKNHNEHLVKNFKQEYKQHRDEKRSQRELQYQHLKQ